MRRLARFRVDRHVAVVCLAASVLTAACVPLHAARPAGSAHAVATPSPTLSLPPNIEWRVRGAQGKGISGFADRTSIRPGDPVGLYVSTHARTFTVDVFRMGWYDGALGRLIETTPPAPGRQQADAVVDPVTHTAVAPWRRSLQLPTAGWPAGDYLLRLDGSDGSRAYVPLTVRGAAARGTVVLISPVTTWQAYNRWGCCSLYSGDDGTFGSRARAVSFDRPYAAERGAGEFITRELPVLAEAERLGLHLDYVTSVDLEADPHLLDGATAVVSMGHDEYWSPAMRAALKAARDSGANLAFFGANAIFRRIRFEDSPLGPRRIEVNYKVGAQDPLVGVNDPAVTSNWPDPPDPQPESSLIGASYSCFTHVRTDGVVVDAGSPFLAGTGVSDGALLPNLIGTEIDQVWVGPSQPRPVEILLHSPFPCAQNGRTVESDTTYYTATSGAGVFDAGTQSWVCAMAATCTDSRTAAVIRRITDNVLRIFAAGPAASGLPAVDNVAHVFALPPPAEVLPQPPQQAGGEGTGEPAAVPPPLPTPSASGSPLPRQSSASASPTASGSPTGHPTSSSTPSVAPHPTTSPSVVPSVVPTASAT